MAANIPTLNALFTSILGDLEAQFTIQIPLFGKNFLRALASVQAAKMKLYYLGIANVQKNIFVDIAEPEAIGGTLERFGVVKLGRRPFTAQPGSYDCTVTGTIGATIVANTTFKSNDDSLNPSNLYVLDNLYTIVAGVNTITLRALEAGLDSKLSIGDNLTATAPIANVDEEVEVTSESIVPLASEDLEDYREKSIEAYQLEPQGGAGSDYRLWSKDAQGVKQSYPYAKSGFPNEVEIFIEATIADSTDGKGTPPQSMLDAVWDGSALPNTGVLEFDPDTSKPLDERGRRPSGMFDIDVNAIVIREIDIEITGYIGLTSTIETNIFNAIKDALSDIRPFVASVDVLATKNDIFNEFKAAFAIEEAEPNSIFTSLSIKIDTAPTLIHIFLDGDIPHLNSVTYV